MGNEDDTDLGGDAVEAPSSRRSVSTRYLTTRPEPGEKVPGIVLLVVVALLLFLLVNAFAEALPAVVRFGTAIAWAAIVAGVLLAVRDAFVRRVSIAGVVLVLSGVVIVSHGAWGPAVGVAAIVTAALFVERPSE
jgi:peptidoglycan/LPS O-acetylase OafA/YrhL